MTDRPRVLLVTGEYPPDTGGVGDYTRCLAEALGEQGAEAAVLTLDRHQGVAAPTSDGPPVFREIGRWGWRSLAAIRSRALDWRADVVHFQYQAAAFGMTSPMPLAPWWLGRSGARRTAVTFHDLREPYLFPKAGPLRRRALAFMAARADLAITTNPSDRAALSAALDRPTPPLQALVPIGSNVPDAPPPGYDRATWRAAEGWGEGTAVVAWFGFLNASKGGMLLVEVLGALRRQGRDAVLLMIGGAVGASDPTDAAGHQRFRAELAARGLSDHVRWTGVVEAPEVSAWLHAADVVCLPYLDGASYRRGSLLAALAHGRPVVSTVPDPAPAGWSPGAHDLVPPPLVDGVNARLVARGDEAGLIAAVTEVLDDRGMAGWLAGGARELAGHFGWGAIAGRHVGLYARVVGP